MNKKILLPVLLLIPISSYAGFKAFTMHSRANCGGFNESISWHYGHEYWLRTQSVHTNPDKPWVCNFWSSNGYDLTWRSAALHFTEGYGGWKVVGHHWTLNWNHESEILLLTTQATDCNIYDGWWDV